VRRGDGDEPIQAAAGEALSELQCVQRELRRMTMERDMLKRRSATSRRTRSEVRLDGKAARDMAHAADMQVAGRVARRVLRVSGPRAERSVAAIFKDRPIESGSADVIELETPRRAEDASVVPVAVRAKFRQSNERSIKRIWIIVDNNPSPVSATIEYTLASGRAGIETRLRIDEYTFVRAIAETNDGRLWMAANFVKASGGCSAPPGKDPQAALASLGKMKFRIDGDIKPGVPLIAQLMISHPNDSGMVMDQATRQYTPSHFVRKVDVTFNGQPVISADLDFSVSENPNMRFYFVPMEQGELRAEVVDSHDLTFKAAVKVESHRLAPSKPAV
jgi:sulfur-oxidizing protein SoxY